MTSRTVIHGALLTAMVATVAIATLGHSTAAELHIPAAQVAAGYWTKSNDTFIDLIHFAENRARRSCWTGQYHARRSAAHRVRAVLASWRKGFCLVAFALFEPREARICKFRKKFGTPVAKHCRLVVAVHRTCGCVYAGSADRAVGDLPPSSCCPLAHDIKRPRQSCQGL